MAWFRSVLLIAAVSASAFALAEGSVLASVLRSSIVDIIEMVHSSVLWVFEKASNFFTFDNFTDLSKMRTHVNIAIVVGAVYLYYTIFIKKLNHVKNLGDIGYIVEPKEDRRQLANMVQKLRLVGDVPPVYPNGWYGVIESHRIEKGRSKTINMLGKAMTVFRGERGRAHVLDSYCPHMGANLGAGGQVKGNNIECPFHGWLFDGDTGKCVHIPYLREGSRIPEVASVHSYIVEETNGFIHIWFHAEGEEPSWSIPKIEEINDGRWIYRGRTEHIINCHIEEVPENGADVAHLKTVHGPALFAGTDLRYTDNKFWKFAEHEWTAQWAPLEGSDSHIAELKLTHTAKVWGFSIPFMHLKVLARQIGPAIVHLHFQSTLGNGIFEQSLTPIEPMTQRLVHNIYASKWMPNIIAKFYMIGEALQVERDLMIWNNKRFAGRPVFVGCAEDTLITKHRRWYKQFYSEHFPKIFTPEKTTDW